MKIYKAPSFVKSYNNRIADNPRLVSKTADCIRLFSIDLTHAALRDHSLSGSKSHLRSFSITSDIRVIYRKTSEGNVVFIDIGTHNEVY